MFFRRSCLLALVLSLLITLPLPSACLAEEVIEDFFSHVAVMPDGVMRVQEDISVRVEHGKIKRGIYRDFPTDYRDARGEPVRVGFEVKEVLLDGFPVEKSITRQSNGVRIKIGDPDSYVPRGLHTYSITYVTTGQLGFFEDHDELYWNVTGNGWEFPILRASARVTLPPGTPLEKLAWYTGPSGSKQKNAAGRIGDNEAYVETTVPLGIREGLTLAVAWPKGYVIPSGDYYRETRRLQTLARVKTLIPLATVMLIFAYYFTVWWLHGKDLRPGRVIPLFHPPEKINPATASYMVHQGLSEEALTSTIIDLAVRGFLLIEELGNIFPFHSGGIFRDGNLGGAGRFRKGVTEKTYILKRTEKEQDELDPMEASFLTLLFPYSDRLVINQSSHSILSAAKKILYQDLKERCSPLIRRNTLFVATGVAITLVLMASSGILLSMAGGNMAIFSFIIAWLSIWTLGVSTLLYTVWKSLSEGIRRKKGSYIARGIFLSVFSVPFVIGQLAGMGIMARSTSVYFALTLVVVLAINVLFGKWMKNYTPFGRTIMDRVEGFKMYLGTAESERIRRFAQLDMPEDTPEQFEKMLPYAIALEVEKEWAMRFQDVLERGAYKPEWYVGPGPFFFYGPDNFTTSLNTGLVNSISSASRAPGSGSGFGGGGSSGGGGGGGGGGGW